MGVRSINFDLMAKVQDVDGVESEIFCSFERVISLRERLHVHA